MAKTEKKPKSLTKEQLLGKLADMEIRLQEAEETLEAIRNGSVDAVVVSGKSGEQIYTLQSIDQTYRLLVESIKEGTVTMSMDETSLYSNKQFADMLGYPLEKIMGSPFPDFIFGEDRHYIEEALRDRTKKTPRFQVRLKSDKSGEIPAQITLGNADVINPDSLTAVITDLSEQNRYHEIVHEEKLSRSIMENSPDGIAVCDAKGMVIRASRALRLFSHEDTLMKPFDEIFRIEIPAKDGSTRLFTSSEVLAGNTVLGVEGHLYSSGKEGHEIILHAVPLRNEDHAIIGGLITITDITERKQAERKEQESQARFLSVLDSSLDVIYRVDVQTGRYEYISPSAERITGFSLDELMAQDVGTALTLIHPDDMPAVQLVFTRLEETGREELEYRQLTKNKDYIWLSNHMSLTKDSAGRPIYRNGNVRDITKRKKAEDTINQQSTKLEAANKDLESFAYSISHDLRAPLRAIDGFSRMLLRQIADKLTDDEKRRFEVIRDNTKKMGQLIDDVLAFSRLGRQSMTFAEIDMAGLANNVWEELLTINPNRRMSLKTETLPDGFGDKAFMRQVLANLLSNSVKFTRKQEDALIEIGGNINDSETVYFVRDNGTGFDMNYYEKLFGVFQRLHNHDEYEGNGAGLAIVQRIIHRHGGRVWAEGEVDKGATFYFTLPKNKTSQI